MKSHAHSGVEDRVAVPEEQRFHWNIGGEFSECEVVVAMVAHLGMSPTATGRSPAFELS